MDHTGKSVIVYFHIHTSFSVNATVGAENEHSPLIRRNNNWNVGYRGNHIIEETRVSYKSCWYSAKCIIWYNSEILDCYCHVISGCF